jgi:acyl-CoA thioesterase FadM
VEATYFKPALMDDWLTMRTHVQKVGASSVRWQTQIHNERTEEVGATFDLTIACMDRVHFKSRPLPPVIRNALLAGTGRTERCEPGHPGN